MNVKQIAEEIAEVGNLHMEWGDQTQAEVESILSKHLEGEWVKVSELRKMKSQFTYVDFSGRYYCNFCGADAYRHLHPEFSYPMPPRPFPHEPECLIGKSALPPSPDEETR